MSASQPIVGLGIDAGGTATRWALARSGQGLLAEGKVGSIGGTLVHSEQGRETIARELKRLALAVEGARQGRPARLWAGISGHDASAGPALPDMIAQALGMQADHMTVVSDIELACRVCFAPGAGHLVFAGTGSFGAFLDPSGQLHRVGGRGPLLGDEGGGHWIARQALAALWRMEDDAPGTAALTPLGQSVFAAIGGSDWNSTRRFATSADRGSFGRLAKAVARAADADPVAEEIMARAGVELARLASLLIRRHGQRPVVVAGRAASLHPRIMFGLLAALPVDTACEWRDLRVHREAALHAAATAG